MANSVDPDQTAPIGAVCSGTTLFASLLNSLRECSNSVVECLTRDRGAAGSRLTGVTALWSLRKTHLSYQIKQKYLIRQ